MNHYALTIATAIYFSFYSLCIGQPNFQANSNMFPDSSMSVTTYYGDLNGDGLPDIISTTEDDIVFWVQSSTGSFTPHIQPLPIPHYHGLRAYGMVFDYTMDGKTDYILPVEDSVVFYTWRGGTMVRDTTVSIKENGNPQPTTIGDALASTYYDFDRDGFMDIAIYTRLGSYSQANPHLAILYGTTHGGWDVRNYNMAHLANDWGGQPSMKAGFLGEDSLPSLLLRRDRLFGYSAVPHPILPFAEDIVQFTVDHHRNISKKGYFTIQGVAENHAKEIAIGDTDGDGVSELVAIVDGPGGYAQCIVQVWKTLDTMPDTTFLTNTYFPQNINITDIDCDHDKEEIIISGQGQSIEIISMDHYMYSATTSVYNSFSFSNNMVVLDLNNDGKKDIVRGLSPTQSIGQTMETLYNTTLYTAGSSGSCLCDGSFSIHTRMNCTEVDGVIITDNTLPSQYIWSTGDTSNHLSSLGQGVYTVTLTDFYGCTSTDTIVIGDHSNADSLFLIDSISRVSCYGESDGFVSITANSGKQPYSYLWDNGDTSSSMVNIASGTYFLTVTDANNCVRMDTLVVTEPYPVIAAMGINDVSCHGNTDGSVIVTPFGGTSPYTYMWNNGSNSSHLAGLSAGSYVVSITDANQCFTVDSIYIVEPSALTVNMQTTHISCYQKNDGTISIIPSGGSSPYAYMWNNGMTSSQATNLAPGSYTITVTDANKCEALATTTLTEPHILAPCNTSDSKTTRGNFATIYPNPVDDFFTLEIEYYTNTTEQNIQGEYTIKSIDGKVVAKNLLVHQTTNIDMTPFASGMYILYVQLGKQVQVFKFVKH